MKYYPKSQIKENLYTDGSEYVIKNTAKVYQGYYYETSNGKKFTGRSPGISKGYLLIPINPGSSALSNEPLNLPTGEKIKGVQNATSVLFEPEEQPFDPDFVQSYPKIREQKTRTIPPPYYFIPPKSQTGKTQFKRYFCKKNNEPIFYEISKETYTNFSDPESGYAIDLYSVACLIWDNSPANADKNKIAVILLQRDLGWEGFYRYMEANIFK